jgi:hypothetical protein
MPRPEHAEVGAQPENLRAKQDERESARASGARSRPPARSSRSLRASRTSTSQILIVSNCSSRLTCRRWRLQDFAQENRFYMTAERHRRERWKSGSVILAGGRGTRLKPFTVALPKPLVPIGEKPILEIIVHQLVNHGFKLLTFAVKPSSRRIAPSKMLPSGHRRAICDVTFPELWREPS